MKTVAIALAGILLIVGLAQSETVQKAPSHQHTATTAAPATKAASTSKTTTSAHTASTSKTAPEAHSHAEMSSMSSGPKTTVTGEIVDLGCYLGHAAKGASHKECATKCIASGMPMGVLTPEGSLYLLTMNHSNGDPFTKAKGMAAETVKITGAVSKRDGMQAIEVDAVELVAAKAPAAGTKS